MLQMAIVCSLSQASTDTRAHSNDAYPGLLTASVLTATCCRRILEEIEHYEAHALSNTLLPLHTRHDDNLGSLERYGFLPLLSALVDATVPKNLGLLCPAKSATKVVARHAFVTRNWVGRTAEFAKFKTHRDKSAITINLCLEKTADVRGSQVLFFHPPRRTGAARRRAIGTDIGASGGTSGNSYRTTLASNSAN
jgi:hypothetical protein